MLRGLGSCSYDAGTFALKLEICIKGFDLRLHIVTLFEYSMMIRY